MPSWQGKSKGTTWGYRVFVWILKNFGVFPAYILLGFVSLYYVFFSFKTTRIVYEYFHHKLGYGVFESLIRIYRNYYLLGQTIIDKVVMMSGIPNKFTFDFEGEENLHEIVRLKKGGLLLSAHLGNWEIAGHLLKRLNTRINIVMFDGEHLQIKDYLASVTGRRKVNVIVLKNDLSHIYQISEAFRNNELVCMHADRFLEGNKTLSIDFMGEKARFPMGPFILATTFQVPISFVFGMKESSLHYHFYASEIKQYSGKPKDVLRQDMLADFAGEMEQKLKRYPEQWFNYFNFWKQ